MADWFESCANCNTPEGCEAVLATVVGTEQTMRTLYDRFVVVDGQPSQELLSQGGNLVSDAVEDAAQRLQQAGCDHSGLRLREMIVDGNVRLRAIIAEGIDG